MTTADRQAPHESSTEATAHALYTALADGDRAVLDEILHAEFVGETTPGLPLGLGGTYHGPSAMRREFWGRLGRAFDVAAQPGEMSPLADGRLMVSGRYVGTARATGVKIDAPFVHLLGFADGRIVGLVQVTDSQQWCAALEGPSVVDPPAPAEVTSAARLTIEHGLGHLRLNRPDAANSIDLAMARDIGETIGRCAADPELRALLISGEGERFCAGGDITLFAREPAALPGLLDDMVVGYHRAISTLCDLPVPVVAAVQGAVAGGGLGLMFASDIVIAAEGTRFAIGYLALGLVSDGGATWFLPKLIGPARAALMFLDNQVIDARQALEWGLVSEVVAPDDLGARAAEIAQRLAGGPTRALAQTRQLLRQGWTTSRDEALDAERRAIVGAAATADAVEGVTAFAAKRRPAFQGR